MSDINVGNTIYLLSDVGRHKDINAPRGGKRAPNSPILGRVFLAVGELNLSLFNAVRHPKKIAFLIFI